MENEQEQTRIDNLIKRVKLLTNGTPILTKASSRDRERIFYKDCSTHLKLYHKNKFNGFEGWGCVPFRDFANDTDDFEIVNGDNTPTKHYSAVELRLVALPIGSFIESPDGLTWEKIDEMTYVNITHGILMQEAFVKKYTDFKIIED